jgi:hypothetical protein
MADAEAQTSSGIVQPKVDDWAYRCIRLENGIEALLVSDPAADKAAASMDVRLLPHNASLCMGVESRRSCFSISVSFPSLFSMIRTWTVVVGGDFIADASICWLHAAHHLWLHGALNLMAHGALKPAVCRGVRKTTTGPSMRF